VIENSIAIAIVALCIGFAIGALVLRTISQSALVRAQERLTAALARADETQQRVQREEQLRSDAERAASASQALAAGLQATLAETSEKQQHAIEALLERTKTELRETTASRASERVGELVAPIAQKLTEFDAFVREIESKRNADTGGLKEQIASLLSRAEKLELTTAQLSSHTSTLVTALRNPATRGKWGEIQLRNVVEKAGMLSYCDFEEQQNVVLETGTSRPDMTINLPGNRRVFVDAKPRSTHCKPHSKPPTKLHAANSRASKPARSPTMSTPSPNATTTPPKARPISSSSSSPVRPSSAPPSTKTPR